ncbi:MAG: type II toxin-antitoxin system antitoxin SocA domain-containing protein [Pirellulaceae bacterium]
MRAVTATSLNALLYYADFLCYKVETRSLNGAAYRRMTHGPVPADYGELRQRMEIDCCISRHMTPSDHQPRTASKPKVRHSPMYPSTNL